MQTNQEKMPEQIVTKNRLMIVEDESIVAMDLSYQLEEMGYEICAVVDNGEDAVFAAAEKTPDLILMDIVINARGCSGRAVDRVRHPAGPHRRVTAELKQGLGK